MKSNPFAMVMTTTTSNEEAERIALALIQQKLAACVQVVPIEEGSKEYLDWIKAVTKKWYNRLS